MARLEGVCLVHSCQNLTTRRQPAPAKAGKPASAQVARLEGFAAARLEDVCLVHSRQYVLALQAQLGRRGGLSQLDADTYATPSTFDDSLRVCPFPCTAQLIVRPCVTAAYAPAWPWRPAPLPCAWAPPLDAFRSRPTGVCAAMHAALAPCPVALRMTRHARHLHLMSVVKAAPVAGPAAGGGRGDGAGGRGRGGRLAAAPGARGLRHLPAARCAPARAAAHAAGGGGAGAGLL